MTTRRIINRSQLVTLARELGVRPDWHEPDEQEVTAECFGSSFDNAGSWGTGTLEQFQKKYGTTDAVEMWVTLSKDGERVADVNLALLFAWATGYETDPVHPRDQARADSTAQAVRRLAAGRAARSLDSLANSLRIEASDLRDLADGAH